jgi:hypothetical protein
VGMFAVSDVILHVCFASRQQKALIRVGICIILRSAQHFHRKKIFRRKSVRKSKHAHGDNIKMRCECGLYSAGLSYGLMVDFVSSVMNCFFT